jgi:glycine cleavage system H lipoate-binding protein
MTCPFLKETQVEYCESAPIRKLIPLTSACRADEKCSSAGYASCQVYRAQPSAEEEAGRCPHFRESAMQYCGAASVARFVPYSETLLSRCEHDGHRYCELYLSMAHPETSAHEVDGVALPDWLSYSANHMWLDVAGDGVCHAGIDAFLSRALGKVDRISYVWTKGTHRPAAVLTVGGIDLEMVFPNNMFLTGCNLYLRSNPSKLTAEPYTGGWLFEGVPWSETEEGLRGGAEARDWMEQEQRRINEFLQQQTAGEAQPLAADGGLFTEGVARRLDPERVRSLFHEFFSPYAGGKRE